tara:strand:- start:27278 stop:31375 length:4098 start_codon:yes stop_codon:yes gene_type:complete
MHLLNKEFIRKKISGTFVLGLFFCSYLFGQHSTNFIHLPFKLDNHNIKVTHTVQDSLGFVWLAHTEGISKYDGYNYEFTPKSLIFKQDTTTDEVKKIFRDSKGVIWALSMNGQISYLQKNGRFLSIDNSIKDFQKEHRVNLIHEDNGIIWLVTNKGSVYSYYHSKGIVDSITTIPANSIGLNEVNSLVVRKSDQLIVSTYKGPLYSYYIETNRLDTLEVPYDYTLADNHQLLLDKKNRLWIGSSYADHGLMVYDFNKESFVQDEIINEQWRGQLSELFTSMYCDVNGVIWLGTDGNGLYRLDLETGDLEIYKHNDLNGFSLSTNTVIGINEDLKNNLWVLTNYGDINILRNRNSQINYHSGAVKGKPARVLSSFKAKDGALWIGTDGDGITKVSANGEEMQFFKNTPESKGFYIHSINEDSDSNIWVGTYKNGLWKYIAQRHKFFKIPLRNSKNNTVMDVRFIFRDSKHRLWVTTDLGIYLYSERNTLLAHFENDSAGLLGGISQSVVEDSSGTIWLAYNAGGLFRFNEDTNNILKSHFTRFSHVDRQLISNKNYHIWSMAASGEEVLWLVLVNGDLIRFDIADKLFEPIRIKGTYENTIFRSVLLENKDNLWLGSTNGIWHLNVKDSISRVFQKSDGLQDDSFMQRSAHNGRDGNFYFGGLNGVNYFKPNQIKKEETVAKLFIEDIDILNQPSISVIPEQIKEGVERIQQLKLEHDQSSFFFRFLAIDNVLFSNYNYAYRLKGFNDNWILSEKERLATYTNIPPGKYVFEVKASTGNGEWDIEQKSVAITILQPFWKSPLAQFLYALLLIGLLYGIVVWIRLRNRVIADELEHKHEKELYALKMNFFAKMSHEIQTPLTLILIPLENMLDRAIKSGNVLLQQRLRLISNNANRLSRIVFELTSLRDKELEKLVLRVSEQNIIADLKEITSSFEEQATFKGINFKCSYPNEELKMWYDKDKMEHVLFNLLSNAFKFTPKGGAITLDVIVEDWERNVKISVTDSGPGIPKEELDNIFQLFYQSDSGKQKVGTGIGLALTKELVDLHHGKIDVKSEPVKGTCFSVIFPIDENRNDSLREDLTVADAIIEVEDIDHEIHEETDQKGNTKLAKTILVVEDNYELQISLKDIFSDYYNVLLAENGEEGYALALEHNPDLIISDIMMPKLDGIEMSGMLQKNELTTHIPIILLTAKKTSKNKLLGLRTGALEYISKPFNISELVLKVNNIITRSDRIILKYKNDLITTPKSGSSRSQDEIFLEKLVGLVENHLSNPEFKLEDLSQDLNMSYSAIYRKFQALTGKKIVDFVRTMRLKKAAILIADCNYSVSEAAFLVGFNDPKYFSKCFKKEFGKNPRRLKGRIDGIEVSDL